MNNELGYIWKEQSRINFKVLSCSLLTATGEIRNLSQDCRSPGQNLNPGPAEYEAGAQTTRLQTTLMCTYVYHFNFNYST
jgi:hypothetical protein